MRFSLVYKDYFGVVKNKRWWQWTFITSWPVHLEFKTFPIPTRKFDKRNIRVVVNITKYLHFMLDIRRYHD